MRNQQQNKRHLLIIVTAVLMLGLTACGPGNADATPTMSVDAIYTAAFHTLAAQQATQLALTPPTPSPSPTIAPTVAPPTAAATAAPRAISFTVVPATALTVGTKLSIAWEAAGEQAEL